LARNTLIITPRDTKGSLSRLPTTAQTARMTPTGCSTLPWTSTRTTSSSPARVVPAQAAHQTQGPAQHRPPHPQRLLLLLLVPPVPRQQLARNPLPQRLPCQMYVFLHLSDDSHTDSNTVQNCHTHSDGSVHCT
jgi:hypothetical protein